jgi:hypothetical protein
MTKSRFARRCTCAFIVVALTGIPALAQDKEPPTRPGKPMAKGDVLSGELTAMRVKSGNKGKRAATYHLKRRAGRAVEGDGRQGNLDQGRRGRLRAGRGADDRSRHHEVERGDEALEHDPEKCEAVFRKDYAQTTS